MVAVSDQIHKNKNIHDMTRNSTCPLSLEYLQYVQVQAFHGGKEH